MRQEADRPNVAALSWIGVGTLLVFGACLLAVVFLLQGRETAIAPHGEPPPPPAVHRSQVGIVNQRLFGEQPENEDVQRRAAGRLATYGWVDRDAGLVHLPIDRAVELVAQGVRP
jgi:hypothetical protein